MALKKAAKKAAKRLAKHPARKPPKKQAPPPKDEKPLKDTLRTYEHLGRISMLVPMLEADGVEAVKSMGALAQQFMRAGETQRAAEVLRAAEHYCFGTLAGKLPEGETLSAELKERIQTEYESLRGRAAEQGSVLPAALQDTFDEMSRRALTAMRAGSFRVALEYARGAEALSRLQGNDPGHPAGKMAPKRLTR